MNRIEIPLLLGHLEMAESRLYLPCSLGCRAEYQALHLPNGSSFGVPHKEGESEKIRVIFTSFVGAHSMIFDGSCLCHL